MGKSRSSGSGFLFARSACIVPVSDKAGGRMVADLMVAVVAAIHVYIVVLEMVLWDKPYGRKTFGLTEEFARQTKVLAANQGLYNGFLAAGLIWGLTQGDPGDPIKVFFLVCVAIAGVYGAATSSIRILFVQTLPAVAALIAVWLI